MASNRKVGKKVEFQGHAFDPTKLLDELGNVLWYVAQTATGLGVTLEDVAQHNVDKLKARYLINCLNGTYDLSDYSFREARWNDFLTMVKHLRLVPMRCGHSCRSIRR